MRLLRCVPLEVRVPFEPRDVIGDEGVRLLSREMLVAATFRGRSAAGPGRDCTCSTSFTITVHEVVISYPPLLGRPNFTALGRRKIVQIAEDLLLAPSETRR